MKKIFTLIFACVATMTVMAQSDGSTVSNSWGLKGSGTQGDPYIISTAADFEAMAKNCNADHKGTGEYFKMTNDIDFGGSADNPVQLPAIGKDGNAQIANIAYGFDGTFDGSGNTPGHEGREDDGRVFQGQGHFLFIVIKRLAELLHHDGRQGLVAGNGDGSEGHDNRTAKGRKDQAEQQPGRKQS